MITIFEDFSIKYKTGDYVYIYGDIPAIIDRVDYKDNYMPYLVNMFTGKDFEGTWISSAKIKRELEPDEIEDFESKIMSVKYNL